MGPRIELRLPDVALLSALSGVAWALWQGSSVALQATAAMLLVATLVAGYVSSGTAVWVRTVHLGTNESPGTSLRHARKVGKRLPCPYPDGWFAVALTEELPPGTLKDVTVCGHNLVVFRPEMPAGATGWPPAAVLDAYCTHLGAHLGIGGTVQGDCIQVSQCLRAAGTGACPAGASGWRGGWGYQSVHAWRHRRPFPFPPAVPLSRMALRWHGQAAVHPDQR
jgi:hypothetical protein